MSSRRVEVVVRRPGQPERRTMLASGVTNFGRAEDNELVLSDIGVSRRHGRVVIEDDLVRIEDLGSGNGTFYRGRQIERQIIFDGDEVVIEPFLLAFRFHFDDVATLEDDETIRAPTIENPPQPPVRLKAKE